MDERVRSRIPPLVAPARIDETGVLGPTRGQAQGPLWRRCAPGLYVPTKADRRIAEQRILEEAGRLHAGGAVTGWASLRLHSVGYLDGLARDGRTELAVPLVIPGGMNMRAAPSIDVHRERLPAADVTSVAGIPVTTPVRAAFDAARRAPDLRSAVVVLDMALAAGVVTSDELRESFGSRRGWRGLRQASRALDLADARTRSPQETALRLIWILDACLPRPRCNWPVADEHGTFLGRPDLLSTELGVIGEYDGAEHRSRARQRDDLRRDDAFRRVGLEPFRVVGADLDDLPLVQRRIEEAVVRAQNLTPVYLIKAAPGPS